MGATTSDFDPLLLASGYAWFRDDSAGGIYALDGAQVTQLDGLPTTGMVVHNNRLARLLRNTEGPPYHAAELVIYDERGVERYLRLDGVSDAHDLSFRDGEYLIVSTGTNEIVSVSPTAAVSRLWARTPGHDSWHLNSLTQHDGRLICTAFGRFDEPRGWSHDPDAPAGMAFDVGSGEEVISRLVQPHHPRFIDGAWLVCNSRRAEILRVDAATGATMDCLALAGFTRGIAVGEDFIYVGESTTRQVEAPDARATVAVIDRTAFQVVDRVPLPVGEIYDLVLVPRALAHAIATGFRTSPKRTADQFSRALFERAGLEPPRSAAGEPLAENACRVRLQGAAPSVMRTDELTIIDVELTNLASAVLATVPPNPVYLAYRWFITTDAGAVLAVDGLRTPLPGAVFPGAPMRCRMQIQAPSRPGRYLLRATLVQEFVRWFEDVDPGNGWEQRVDVDE